MRKGALFLTVGAVLLLAAGAAARFVVLPAVHQVPSNVDNTLRYSGTVSMINPAALAAGDTSRLFLTNVAVTAEQRVKTVSVSGRTAVMSSDIAVKGPDGASIITSSHLYALDRVTLEAAQPPAGASAEPHTGLALGFPLTPQRKDYQYWDPTTQTATPARYSKTETKAGREAFVFTVHAEGSIKDPKIQAMLPDNLPKAIIPLVANNLPAAIQQLLIPLLQTLPDNLPLTYTSTTDTTFWVDSATGIVLDADQHQVIKAQLGGALAAAPLPAAFDLSINTTDETTNASAEQARQAANGLLLVGTYLPIGLGALGVVLLVLGIIFALRKPKDDRREVDAVAEPYPPI
ncbi:porin PorA family protein [Allorhizocola rhizosphaerae]|uniref:porin PorA family protein n=1 Tax=Allorhizocola rhizosphaerae TaxID=1872709 RepID=UPI000E3E6E04|nr:porin PorA family protein [Allorhizocola rhizosphaerae]